MKLESSGEAEVGVIQITGSSLTKRQVRDICDSLRNQNLTVLALRECQVGDHEYKRLLKAVAVCQSLLQINFNVDLVNSEERVTLLARCLRKNTSIKSLYLHGSDLSGDNLDTLVSSLKRHKSLISLDVGDCDLNDDSIEYIIPLLSPHKHFQGLVELGLSGNTGVSGAAWCRLFQAMASCHHSCRLSSLYLDYCHLGDMGVTCLATAMATLATLRTVDLECTGITDAGAQFLLYLAETQKQNRLETINLNGNDVNAELVEAIQKRLQTSPTPSIESESESGSESDFRQTIIKDPVKLEALNTLTRALSIYSRQLLAEEENGEEVNVEGDGDRDPDHDLDRDLDPRTEPQADDDEDDEPDGEDEETRSRITLQSLSSLSDQDDVVDDDDVTDTGDDVIQTEEAAPRLVAETDDDGDFLKEIRITPQYSVIQPVTILSRASKGYFF